METNQIILLNNLLNEELLKYRDISREEIIAKLEINSNSKNINRMIFDRIINCSKNKAKIINLLDSFSCVIKTVNLEWNNLLKESMSLNVFKYNDIYEEDRDTSTLRQYFLRVTFVFVVFKKDGHDCHLENIKVWKMPLNVLDGGVRDTWIKTKELISAGKIVNYIDKRNRFITYFPTSGDTKFIHVRPHAQNREDTLPLPIKDRVTGRESFVKHSFWLNSSFVRKIVVEDKYYE